MPKRGNSNQRNKANTLLAIEEKQLSLVNVDAPAIEPELDIDYLADFFNHLNKKDVKNKQFYFDEYFVTVVKFGNLSLLENFLSKVAPEGVCTQNSGVFLRKQILFKALPQVTNNFAQISEFLFKAIEANLQQYQSNGEFNFWKDLLIRVFLSQNDAGMHYILTHRLVDVGQLDSFDVSLLMQNTSGLKPQFLELLCSNENTKEKIERFVESRIAIDPKKNGELLKIRDVLDIIEDKKLLSGSIELSTPSPGVGNSFKV